MIWSLILNQRLSLLAVLSWYSSIFSMRRTQNKGRAFTYCPTGDSLATSHATLITPPFLASASWNVLPDASEGCGSSLHLSILSSVTSTTQTRLSATLALPCALPSAWEIFPLPTSFPSLSISETRRPGSNEKDLVKGRHSIMFWESSPCKVSCSLPSGLTSLLLPLDMPRAAITLAGGT
uniref:Secreted protein n=1 Tax=Arundo donax TaxID=35708 RepID=A0A0A8XZW1_ARUDO